MSYEIIIKRKEIKEVTKRGEFTMVSKVPWTDEEIAKRSESFYTSRQMDAMREVKDYAPDWNGIETVETELLKQTVEELDLAAVIRAINKL